jgi:ABC-type dipeptide/oligopeptide/nickel transport system permease component
MTPLYMGTVNLTASCLTTNDLSGVLFPIMANTVWVAQEFATAALLIGVALGFWIGINWERQKWAKKK